MAQPWPSHGPALLSKDFWLALCGERRSRKTLPRAGARAARSRCRWGAEAWWRTGSRMVNADGKWWWNVGFYGISWENGMNGDLIGISWSKMIFSQLAVTSSPWKYPACFSHDLAVFWIEINFAYGILWQMSGPVFEKKNSCDMWKNVEHTK